MDDNIGVKINGVLYVRLDDVRPMRDEIEQLREALETYAEECHGACCIEGYRQGPGCGYIARAALAGTPK